MIEEVFGRNFPAVIGEPEVIHRRRQETDQHGQF
jgi:hypothetical protein